LSTIESAVFDPPTVRIEDAEPRLAEAESAGTLFAYADMEALPSVKIPGPHAEKSVKILRAKNDHHRVVTPSEVSVSFNVREANATYTIPSVAVFVLASANIQSQYKIAYDPILPRVTVVGPPQKIELLRREDYQPKPRAVLDLSKSDVENPRLKTLRFIDLPEGVTVDDASARREVTFTATERPAGE